MKAPRALSPNAVVIQTGIPTLSTVAQTKTGISKAVTNGPASDTTSQSRALAAGPFQTQTPRNCTPRAGMGLQLTFSRSKWISNPVPGLPTWTITAPDETRSATAAWPISWASVISGITKNSAANKPISQSTGLMCSGPIETAIDLSTGVL